MNIIHRPIAFVKNSRKEPIDDHWGDIVSEIVLTDEMPEEALSNIELFSHLEIIYHFNQLPPEHVAYSRKPRGSPAFPSMGILAQRNKDRPNSIGLCTVELLKHQGKSIQVKTSMLSMAHPYLILNQYLCNTSQREQSGNPNG